MATDIMDTDMKALRNARWDKAFSKKEKDDDVNRKATIVIEQYVHFFIVEIDLGPYFLFLTRATVDKCSFSLIQASDVAHTVSQLTQSFI